MGPDRALNYSLANDAARELLYARFVCVLSSPPLLLFWSLPLLTSSLPSGSLLLSSSPLSFPLLISSLSSFFLRFGRHLWPTSVTCCIPILPLRFLPLLLIALFSLPPRLFPLCFQPLSPLLLVPRTARLIILPSFLFSHAWSHARRHHLLIWGTSPPSGLPSLHISSSHPLHSVSSPHSYPTKKTRKNSTDVFSESNSLIPLIPISLSPHRRHHSPLLSSRSSLSPLALITMSVRVCQVPSRQ